MWNRQEICTLTQRKFSFQRDLGKLLRHPKFQEEYDAANRVLAKEHGSVGMYLASHSPNVHNVNDDSSKFHYKNQTRLGYEPTNWP